MGAEEPQRVEAIVRKTLEGALEGREEGTLPVFNTSSPANDYIVLTSHITTVRRPL
jgi:hypothetical protein